MNFTVVDFETANPNFASICQVGVVVFQDGKVVDGFDSLVNPEDYFCPMNVDIHGIDEDAVASAPNFPQIYESIVRLLTRQTVVCHTSFDMVALRRVSEKYKLVPIECAWLDSARVVRRTWHQFARKGYGLGNVTTALGIEFKHHDAKEDARAAGEVLLRAITESGIKLEEWVSRVKKPIFPVVKGQVNLDGHLVGEVLVFTGALSIPRGEASVIAANAGCTVTANVTLETTLLVVGDQDISRLVGYEKSSKHRRAEALMAKGQRLRIIGELDFIELLKVSAL